MILYFKDSLILIIKMTYLYLPPALHCASSRGHKECVETLVKEKAPLEKKDKNGCTPLFYAITLGHSECAKLLMEKGANPNHQDSRGRR